MSRGDFISQQLKYELSVFDDYWNFLFSIERKNRSFSSIIGNNLKVTF